MQLDYSMGNILQTKSTFPYVKYIGYKNAPYTYTSGPLYTPILNILNGYTTYPFITDIHYNDLDSYSKTKKIMLKYYRSKIPKWLMTNFKDLLNYFAIKNDEVRVVKGLSDLDVSNDRAINKKKVEYIMDNILTRKIVYRLLKQFVEETNTKWALLVNQAYFVKQVVNEYLKQYVRNKINT